MKIKFTKLPTTDGTIKVSLDGGQSFTDYNVADVHESGIPLGDNQDYEKIQVKAPANVLKNLDIVASVKVEGEGAETGSTNEPSFIMDTDTYGFNFPSCVAGIILPNGITTIDKNVFSTYPNLQTVVIPEGVTTIGQSAFSSCKGLTSITIPNSVTSIDRDAFYYCTSLKTINYTGTEEQWNAISKGTDWNYETSLNVIYNYKPEKKFKDFQIIWKSFL